MFQQTQRGVSRKALSASQASRGLASYDELFVRGEEPARAGLPCLRIRRSPFIVSLRDLAGPGRTTWENAYRSARCGSACCKDAPCSARSPFAVLMEAGSSTSSRLGRVGSPDSACTTRSRNAASAATVTSTDWSRSSARIGAIAAPSRCGCTTIPASLEAYRPRWCAPTAVAVHPGGRLAAAGMPTGADRVCAGVPAP